MATFSGTDNLTSIHTMDSSTDTINYGTQETELMKEGTACASIDLDIETHAVGRDSTTVLSLANSNIYIWGMSLTASYLDLWENGGIRIELTDSSGNSATWYVAGRDIYQGGWVRFVCNTSTTPDEISGTINYSNIETVTLVWKGTVKSKLAVNTFTDSISYGNDGEGLTLINGTSAGGEGSFSDILIINNTLKSGIIREKSGVYYINGALNIGDSAGTADTYFNDTSKIVRCEDKYRIFTTTNRTSAESLVTSSFFSITTLGNSTGVTSFILGEKSGTQGISGCVLSSPLIGSKLNLNFENTDVDYLKIYGCKIQNGNITNLPDYIANDKETLSASWSKSGIVDVGTGLFKYNSLISSPSGGNAAIRLDQKDNNTSDCQFIGCDIGVELTEAGASIPVLIYDLATYNPSTYLVGDEIVSGTPTFVHTSDIYAQDYEGIYRSFGANERVVKHGRSVRNLVFQTENFADSVWVTTASATVTSNVSDPDGGTNAATLTTASSYQGIYQIENNLILDNYYIISCWMRRRTGTGNVLLYLSSGERLDVPLTSSWRRYSHYLTEAITSTGQAFRIELATSGDEIDIYHPQTELSSGRTDQISPSEYIKTEATNPMVSFANENGNTVTSDVVTENISTTLLDPLPIQIYQKSIENVLYPSYNLDPSTTSWSAQNTGTALLDEIGLTGAENTATTVDDSSTSEKGAIYRSYYSPDGTVPVILKTWVKKTSGSIDNYPAVGIHVTGDDGYVVIDTTNGTIVDRTGREPDDSAIISDGDWWVVLVEVIKDYTFSTQNVYIQPAYNDDGTGVQVDAAIGTCIIGNAEVYIDKSIEDVKYTCPVFTTDNTLTTDEIINTYPSANWSNSEAPIYIVFDYKGIDQDIILNNAVAILYIASDVLYLTDGTNTASLSCSVSGLCQVGIVLDTTNNKMKLNLDGSYSSEVNYDGSFGTGNITNKADIFNFKSGEATDYTIQQTLLDAWMLGNSGAGGDGNYIFNNMVFS